MSLHNSAADGFIDESSSLQSNPSHKALSNPSPSKSVIWFGLYRLGQLSIESAMPSPSKSFVVVVKEFTKFLDSSLSSTKLSKSAIAVKSVVFEVLAMAKL